MIFKKKDTDQSTNEESKARLGWGWKTIYILAAISLVIYVTAIFWQDFADLFNRYPAAAVRALLSYVTYLLPISLAELMLIALIPAVVAVIIIAYKKYCDTWHDVFLFGAKLFSAIMIFFILFVWTLGTGYRTTPLDERLGFDGGETTPQAINNTCNILIELVNATSADIEYGDDDFSVMPYSLDEMNEKLMAAYGKVCDKHSFIPRLYSRTKPVMMSELMSYTHITGIYSYFTGEANINIVFPDFTIPYTAAHELAHQRGIAREDEANFVAFLVCLESDDPYIRYSGYVMMLSYLLDAHYAADKSDDHADYKELYSKLALEARKEQRAYYDFFQKYANNIAASVSGVVNDTYLQSQGTQGSVSYGLVVDLAVKYYANKAEQISPCG